MEVNMEDNLLEIQEKEFYKLRTVWKQNLIGFDETDINDSEIQNLIHETMQKAVFLWDSMDKSENRKYLWKEYSCDTISGHITECYIRLKDMALAYCMTGSKLEGNKQLLRDIIDGLEWLYENRYNENSSYYDNWWPWDIGIPLRLNDIVVLIYEELTKEQINKFMTSIGRFVSDPTLCRPDRIRTTGANRVDMCKIVAISGIILKNEAMILLANEALREVFQYVTHGDGFYRDGSFLQHDAIPYTCSYGYVLIEGLAEIITLLADSPWELAYQDVNNIYDWIYNSYEPLIYKGAAMDMARGRAVSRYFLQDYVVGHKIISSVLKLSICAPKPQRLRLKSMVKSWIISDSRNSFFSNADAVAIKLAKRLVEDISIPPKKEHIGHWNFSNMDRIVHRAPGYAFAISMYSKRIQNYEDMNDENKKAWYTSDGMTYLYNNDINHYSDGFWPTVNPYRMAGTTVDTAERQVVLQKDGIGGQRKSNNVWVGGTTLSGLYGAAGMDLESGFSSLTAKKSWFMFQEEIVALGAGITSCDNRNIETIIENRMLEGKGYNTLVVDDEIMPGDLRWNASLDNIKWIHLEGSNTGSDIGYYFPDSANVKTLREERRGCWNDINADGPRDEIYRNYLTLWINHGINPVKAKYCYVLLPGKNIGQVKSYAENPDILVLKNSMELQAVKNIRLGIIAANLWEDKKITIDYISCNRKASFMVMEKGKEIELSVSDPTMENEGFIEIEVRKVLKDIVSIDSDIEVQKKKEYTKFIVNVKEAKGRTFSIKFSI
jgi:hyaluronate lyase